MDVTESKKEKQNRKFSLYYKIKDTILEFVL